jgi:formylmethanofuran dehydrogenase subunit E
MNHLVRCHLCKEQVYNVQAFEYKDTYICFKCLTRFLDGLEKSILESK